MAYAVFIKDPNTGDHYRRTIWYDDNRREDADRAFDAWDDIDGTEAIMVRDKDEKGE